MHVHKIQGVIFSDKKSLCGALHNIAKGLVPLFVAILPLFAFSHSASCRCLPLAITLLAANSNKLLLFVFNDVYSKLPKKVNYIFYFAPPGKHLSTQSRKPTTCRPASADM